MQCLKLQETIDAASAELRASKRKIASLERRMSQLREQATKINNGMYAQFNMATEQQRNPQQYAGSPRAMAAMVGTMPQLPINVLNVSPQQQFRGKVHVTPDRSPKCQLLRRLGRIPEKSKGAHANSQGARGGGYASIHSRGGPVGASREGAAARTHRGETIGTVGANLPGAQEASLAAESEPPAAAAGRDGLVDEANIKDKQSTS